jgi:hypothetical protein
MTDKHISDLAIYSVRYALPRKTAAPGEVIAAMKTLWVQVGLSTQYQIVKEISQYLTSYVGLDLPDDIRKEWQEFLNWVPG